MAKYLISFPSKAMHIPDGELAAISRDSHAVVQQAKDAGVYVFAGGIDDSVAPVLVAGDGAVSEGGYPWARPLDGGVDGGGSGVARGGDWLGRADCRCLPLSAGVAGVLF